MNDATQEVSPRSSPSPSMANIADLTPKMEMGGTTTKRKWDGEDRIDSRIATKGATTSKTVKPMVNIDYIRFRDVNWS